MNSKTLRMWSLVSFAAALPALIVTDWYLKGFGLLVMVSLGAAGLALYQLTQICWPPYAVDNTAAYKRNKQLKLSALLLFVMSPMALVYGNKLFMALGVSSSVGMVCLGIVLDQLARIRYPYRKLEQEEKTL